MNLLFGFSGRIGRMQWWLAQLAVLIVIAAALAVILSAVDPDELSSDRSGAIGSAGASIVLIVCAVCVLIVWINLACTVKRFHDRDKSGWWVLIVFVPYIGAIWQIVECGFLSGSRGPNRFGPPPGSGDGHAFDDVLDDVAVGYSEPERSRRLTPVVQQQASAPRQTGRSSAGGFGRRGLS
jgi:uncharacterized membrane protein YhaH (DUF805 family)